MKKIIYNSYNFFDSSYLYLKFHNIEIFHKNIYVLDENYIIQLNKILDKLNKQHHVYDYVAKIYLYTEVILMI
jgi:hypothetical protein